MRNTNVLEVVGYRSSARALVAQARGPVFDSLATTENFCSHYAFVSL